MQPVANPALPEIARRLPADTAYQITRTAERLGFTDYSDVLAEVANVVIRTTASPKGAAMPTLAGNSFPSPPLAARASTGSAAALLGRTNSSPKPARSKRRHSP